MNKVICVRCNWRGNFEDCEIDDNGHTTQCPSGSSYDSIVEDDGVSEDDYRNQDERGVPNE